MLMFMSAAAGRAANMPKVKRPQATNAEIRQEHERVPGWHHITPPSAPRLLGELGPASREATQRCISVSSIRSAGCTLRADPGMWTQTLVMLQGWPALLRAACLVGGKAVAKRLPLE